MPPKRQTSERTIPQSPNINEVASAVLTSGVDKIERNIKQPENNAQQQMQQNQHPLEPSNTIKRIKNETGTVLPAGANGITNIIIRVARGAKVAVDIIDEIIEGRANQTKHIVDNAANRVEHRLNDDNENVKDSVRRTNFENTRESPNETTDHTRHVAGNAGRVVADALDGVKCVTDIVTVFSREFTHGTTDPSNTTENNTLQGLTSLRESIESIFR